MYDCQCVCCCHHVLRLVIKYIISSLINPADNGDHGSGRVVISKMWYKTVDWEVLLRDMDIFARFNDACIMNSYLPLAHHLVDPVVLKTRCQYHAFRIYIICYLLIH